MKIFSSAFFFLAIFCALFFTLTYHLDYTALESYDEAWYATITRNLVSTGNPFYLIFNDQVFTDHPPFGFILMAIPTFLLGSNEFSARVLSAALGSGSILLLYLAGVNIKNKFVGGSASLILFSSLWFIFRARSGNLDIPFLFWSLATVNFLLAVPNKRKYLYGASICFALLFLTKTLIGLGILPIFLYVVWKNRKMLGAKLIIGSALVWLGIVLPWYLVNQLRDQSFLYHHFIEIGSRSHENIFQIPAVSKTLFYLQVGLGKWYKVFLISIFVAIFVWFKRSTERNSQVLIMLYLIGFLLPFLFSQKVEVWHLIPTYPAIALLIAFSLQEFATILLPKIKVINYLVLGGILLIAGFQFRQFSNLIYANEPRFSSEKDISIKANSYPSLALMETFYPAAVYYSNQNIIPLYWSATAYEQMVTALKNPADEQVFITNQTFIKMLTSDNVPFSVLDKNDSYLLIQ